MSQSNRDIPTMVRWFDPKTLKPGGDTKADYPGPLSYCGQTGLVAAADRESVFFIRENDHKVSYCLKDPKLGVAHQGKLLLSVNGNGDVVVTGGSDGRLKLWGMATGKLLADLSLGVPYVRPVFSPDGRYVATPAGRRVIVYEVGGSDVCRTIAVCDQPVRAIDVSRSGDRLAAVVGAENEPGEVLIWDLAENQLESRTPVLSTFTESTRAFLSIHPSDPFVAFNDGYELLHVCRLGKGLTVDGSAQINGKQFAYGTEPDVLWALPRGGGVVRLDLATRRVLSRWEADLARITDGADGIGCMAASDNWALAGVDNGTVALLRASDGRQAASFEGPGGAVSALAMSHDEILAACGTVKGLARIISISERRRVCDLLPQDDQINALAISEGKRLLATACRDGQVRLWQLGRDSAEELVRLQFPGGPVDDVRFLSGDSDLAVLVHKERGVRLIDLGRLRDGLRKIRLDW
jgi:WD40 repeat protein